MNVIEQLKTLFSSKKKSLDSEAELFPNTTETTDLILGSDVMVSAMEAVHAISEAKEEPLPHWLSSEDALRDEGVIFGLSDSEAEEKITVIKSFFKHQTADIEKEVERFSEKIGELNLFIEQKENRIVALKNKSDNLETAQPQDHNLLRTTVGLLLAVGMCVGNYFLIDSSLTPNFPQNHPFIAVGILLAGMFNLFGKVSFFHEKNTSVSWRQITEEIGLPLMAAFFVFTQSIDNQTLLRSISLFGFVFFLFLFTGKLVLSNLSVIKSDATIWQKNVRLKRDKTKLKEKWDEEIFNLEKEIDDLRIEKWQILPDLNQAEASLERYTSKRDSLIKLFESEFRLARSYRDKLSAKQVKTIFNT